MNPLTNISNEQFISQKRMNLFKKKKIQFKKGKK